MSIEKSQNALRLRKRHGTGKRPDVSAKDGARLVNAQSIRNAVVAALISILIFSVFSIAVSALSNRVFPWLTVGLGLMIGHAVRLAGRGTDWRFPAVAVVLTLLGAVVSNIVVSASVSAERLGIGTLDVLQSVTGMTWPVFFAEKLGIADAVFAVFGAALAAFYANRRLSRQQYHSLRLWQQERSDD